MAEPKQQSVTNEVGLDRSPFAILKYTYACALLVFSITIIMGLIFTGQTAMSKNQHPVVAFVVCWGTLIWLSMVEGGQCSLVGLPPIDRKLYQKSHPITYQICEVAHKGDNLNRYLLGRQFLVVFIVFFINMSAAPMADATLWGMPQFVITIFLQTGVAMILLTAQVGQLAAQCSASHKMLDYINNSFMVFTLAVSMFVEFSGLVHASYVIEHVVTKLAGKSVESKEPPRSIGQSIFFWGRCLMSVVVLTFSLVVTLTALFEGKTTMYKGVNEWVAVILFFLLMSVVGLLEGMQIAFFAVSKMTKEERGNSRFAKMTCDLLFDSSGPCSSVCANTLKGQNLPGFMIGRQMCVVGCMFIVAKVCTLNVEVGTGQNVLGVSDGVQAFLNTGLLAALITTIVGSIAWQLLAGAFPLAFLSNPLVYALLRWCLFLEFTGICSGSWVIGHIWDLVVGYKNDEYYVGTAEERKQREIEEEENSKVACTQLMKVLTEYKNGSKQADLASFVKQMNVDSQLVDVEAPSAVEMFMAFEGQCDSGVKNFDSIAQEYEPTPKSHRYPMPQQVAERALAEHGEIPCFLLPPSHPLHVPPHIVACWLMSEARQSEPGTVQSQEQAVHHGAI